MRWITGIACAFLPLSGAMAQPAGGPQQVKQLQEMISHARIIGPESLLSAAIPGAPYAAEEITQFDQTLGDGTHIRREEKTAVYRDSQGRTRRETPSQITIIDPVAGVGYVLNPKAMTGQKMTVSITRTGTSENATVKSGTFSFAIRQQTGPGSSQLTYSPPPEGVAGGVVGGIAGPASGERQIMMYRLGGGAVSSHSTAKPESLGSQSIEGVECEGTRTTDTIPAGAIGNDRPIQTIVERWYSPELKTLVLSKRTDPRNGDETFRLTNVRRTEPAATLFQLPAGYQIAQ